MRGRAKSFFSAWRRSDSSTSGCRKGVKSDASAAYRWPAAPGREASRPAAGSGAAVPGAAHARCCGRPAGDDRGRGHRRRVRRPRRGELAPRPAAKRKAVGGRRAVGHRAPAPGRRACARHRQCRGPRIAAESALGGTGRCAHLLSRLGLVVLGDERLASTPAARRQRHRVDLFAAVEHPRRLVVADGHQQRDQRRPGFGLGGPPAARTPWAAARPD